MRWHPTLDDLEQRPDTAYQPRRPYPRMGAKPAPGTGPDDYPIACLGCWCGNTTHDGMTWPGKENGAPHPPPPPSREQELMAAALAAAARSDLVTLRTVLGQMDEPARLRLARVIRVTAQEMIRVRASEIKLTRLAAYIGVGRLTDEH